MAARLHIKVVPKSAKDEVAGWMGTMLKIRVTAAPERGKANDAVLDTLAKALQLPRRVVRLVAGATSQRKIIEVQGLTDAELLARLGRSAKR